LIELDVNRLITQLEQYAENKVGCSVTLPLLSDADKAEALKLGRSADLTGDILRDMARLGMIGEENQQAHRLPGDDQPQDG